MDTELIFFRFPPGIALPLQERARSPDDVVVREVQQRKLHISELQVCVHGGEGVSVGHRKGHGAQAATRPRQHTGTT